jgi:hypothetical protein
MNLRRGLLRLWLVLSIGWIIAGGVHAYSLWPEPVGPWTAYQALEWSYPVTKELPTTGDLIDEVAQRRERWIVQSHLEWAFGPPLAILIIGGALGWAIAGFRRG